MKPSFFHIPYTLYNMPNIVALTRAVLFAYIMNIIDKENYVVGYRIHWIFSNRYSNNVEQRYTSLYSLNSNLLFITEPKTIFLYFSIHWCYLTYFPFLKPISYKNVKYFSRLISVLGKINSMMKFKWN